MSNCSDTGLQGSSPRDARFMRFVADGPGIAGFKFEVDPDVDGDEAAQFIARADKARCEETDLRLNRANDWANCDSLEALEGLGVEIDDVNSLKVIAAYEDAEEVKDLPSHLVAQFDESDDEGEDDEEGAIVALDPKYLCARPTGAISTFRSLEVNEQASAGRRQGAPRFNTEAICRKAVETAKFISKVIVAEEKRMVAEAKAAVAKPASPKGNGNGRKPAMPPVGKFLRGTVVEQFSDRGLHVEVEGIGRVRVPIAFERGHGSWSAAAAWLLGFKPGIKVRLKVIAVNGAIYAVLSDRHPRPFWKKEVNSQQVEARPAN